MKFHLLKRLSISSILLLGACNESKKTSVWIYTSTYKEVLELYKAPLAKEFPDVDIQWFQAGSENVAARLTAEIAGGAPKADLIMTSDLFFYQELKERGQLLKLESPALASLPAPYVDADKTFAVTRFPVMVIAYNKRKIDDKPKGFRDLLSPRFKGKLTMPSPLESGTALTTSLYLFHNFGASYFDSLRAQDVLSAGGNGATMARIESGEKPVGIVLMENVLQSREKGKDWVEFIVPEEGALAMPSPVAVFKATKNPVIAQKIFDWFLSKAAQEILIKGWVYSPFHDTAAPNGAPAWSSLKMQTWDLPTFKKWGQERQNVKDLFQKTVLK